MTGMTPEQLERIRFTLQGGFHLHRDTERAIALDLLAEVERLRAGIEALEESMRQNWGDKHRAHSPYEMGCQTCAADTLRRLLNPTEGEDDE